MPHPSPQPFPARVPASTYRLQFGPTLTFADALALVPYLHRLGITDLYASPLTAPCPGSTHGYDVADPTRLNPDLGDDDDFTALADALAGNAMGLLLDIVPNHMAAHHTNPWWWSLLQLGRDSPHAEFFDIRWDDDPDGKLVLPILADTLDACLARRDLRLRLDDDPARGITIAHHDDPLPVNPAHWPDTLRPLLPDPAAALGPASPAADALARLLDASDPAQIRARFTEALAADPAVRILLRAALDAAPPETVRAVLARQAYRPELWRTGLQRLNYRRFFDISDLVTLAADRPPVFDASHALVRRLIARGSITGLRIDHIDGLADPADYLRRLRALAQSADASAGASDPESPPGPVYTVVEKILARHETLPHDWPVEGATGYDFLNALTHAATDPRGIETIAAHAARTLPLPHSFADAVYDAKRAVMRTLFSAEMRSLTRHLSTLARARGSDLPEDDLAEALAATTASLRVYRTYITQAGPSQADRAEIEHALRNARQRTDAHDAAFDFLRANLLPDQSPISPDTLAFIRRWQQHSGGITAKGVEDTAFYRHITLVALNEVGGQPDPLPDPVAAFHAFCTAAARHRPHSLCATSTHDTKRSEDARARLCVLSEIPDRWTACLDRWRRWNAPLKRAVRGVPAPSPRDELLIYQSLAAIWPLEDDPRDDTAARLTAAMVKSAREAKLQTSWTDPDPEYEAALGAFITAILAGASPPFLADFLHLMRPLAPAGAVNSLAQLTLKLAAPGVPDFYQGTELWHFALVDPDNRRPVDFARRADLLADIEQRSAADRRALLADLVRGWPDGRIKLYATWRGLHARRARRHLFSRGDYLPLTPAGPRAGNLIAFARHTPDDGDWAIAIAPRLPVSLLGDTPDRLPLGPVWQGTTLPLPPTAPHNWVDAFTGEHLHAPSSTLPLAPTLSLFPTALLLPHAP